MSNAIQICEECGQPTADIGSHRFHAHDETDIREQVCEYCGESFERDARDQRFCSHDCANKARRRIHDD